MHHTLKARRKIMRQVIQPNSKMEFLFKMPSSSNYKTRLVYPQRIKPIKPGIIATHYHQYSGARDLFASPVKGIWPSRPRKPFNKVNAPVINVNAFRGITPRTILDGHITEMEMPVQ